MASPKKNFRYASKGYRGPTVAARCWEKEFEACSTPEALPVFDSEALEKTQGKRQASSSRRRKKVGILADLLACKPKDTFCHFVAAMLTVKVHFLSPKEQINRQ